MIRALALVLALATPAAAQDAARDAAIALQQAAARLTQTSGTQARIDALTQAVAAYDAGLAALRDGLRQISARQAALERDLDRREDRVSRLIGVLTGIERTPRPLLLLHPEGPTGTARAAMLLGEAAPALEAEAALLRADLETLATLRGLEEQAATSLEDGLDAVQAAREAVSIAIADRGALPPRFAADGAALQDLRDRAATLAAFAEGLQNLPGPADASAGGPLPLPARGTVLRGYREPDAAGIERPGLVLSVSPQAPVLAPTRATVRHVGPLLDYGLVVILEPRPGALIVLAGLERAYVERGRIVAPGTPLGLMGQGAVGENGPGAAENSEDVTGNGGAFLDETLYVETREGDAPVDPARWFDLTGAVPPSDD